MNVTTLTGLRLLVVPITFHPTFIFLQTDEIHQFAE
jgi:hypothetical protein